MSNKFYWLIQNSWGSTSGDQGFVKIEFGQVGVESIAFSEPYIEEETTPVEIPVTLKSVDAECNLVVEVANEYLNSWKNSLQVKFKYGDANIRYQCSVLSTKIKGNEYNCYVPTWDLSNKKGVYNFDSYESLGTENKFTIDASQISGFNLYGLEHLYPLLGVDTQGYYVSEKGSKIIFYYDPSRQAEEKVPYIYPLVSPYPFLSNCKRERFDSSGIYLIYCELTEDELSNFKTTNKIEMAYLYECNYYVDTYTYVYKLDTTNYPVFRIKSAFLEKADVIDYYTEFTMTAKIDGSISSYTKDQMFVGFAHIEYNNKNTTYLIVCYTGIPEDESKDHSISCYMNFNKGQSEKYDNLYILPYIVPYQSTVPYEVIINEVIKVSDGTEPDTDIPHPTDQSDVRPVDGSSNYIRLYSLFSSIILIILL